MDVAAGGAARRGEQVVEHQDMQHAHPQAAPVGALVGGQPIHGGVGTKPREQPLAVGDGSEAKHVLVAGALDGVPGGAAAGFSGAGGLQLEFGPEPGASSSVERPRKPETKRWVGRMSRPGSLMPTSIMRQKFDGWSGPSEGSPWASSSRYFSPVS